MILDEEYLDLSDTGIMELPDDLEVGRDVIGLKPKIRPKL